MCDSPLCTSTGVELAGEGGRDRLRDVSRGREQSPGVAQYRGLALSVLGLPVDGLPAENSIFGVRDLVAAAGEFVKAGAAGGPRQPSAPCAPAAGAWVPKQVGEESDRGCQPKSGEAAMAASTTVVRASSTMEGPAAATATYTVGATTTAVGAITTNATMAGKRGPQERAYECHHEGQAKWADAPLVLGPTTGKAPTTAKMSWFDDLESGIFGATIPGNALPESAGILV